MKKGKISKIITVFMIFLMLLSLKVYADVGSFESYDSGGSSSSWDSGSSWSSSYDDSDYDYDYTGTSNFELFFIVVVLIIIVYSSTKNRRNKKEGMYRVENNMNSLSYYSKKEQIIEQQVRRLDVSFCKEEFIAWSKDLFVKLQQAWTERDWSTIRTFETTELYEQHKNQLQGYIDNNQINVMDRICVNFAYLDEFRLDGDKEVLVVKLNSRMADYIIDATTKEVLRGDKYTERVNTYLMTFVRKKGLKTIQGTNELKTTNCPNCGAPTQITSSGKCEYCGSVITTEEHGWVLANFERYNGR